MVIRYVVSHMGKDGIRWMSFACQGRETKATREEAERSLHDLLTANTQERLESIFGLQATGTFEVSAVNCYDSRDGMIGDPVGPGIREELNPGQKCTSDELQAIIDSVEGKKVPKKTPAIKTQNKK